MIRNIFIIILISLLVVFPVSAWTSAGGCWTAVNGSYTIIMWNTTGTSSFTIPLGISNFEYLVVGGGGGGAGNAGGGGGAGGFRNGTDFYIVPGATYNISVGAGGDGGSASGTSSQAIGRNGSVSRFGNLTTNITSAGGGGGGAGVGDMTRKNGEVGGCGGGSSQSSYMAAGNTPSTTPSQGKNGGTGATSANYGSGGGGGASMAGGNGTTSAGGNGGNGQNSTISGILVTYSGGGGAGINTGTAGSGGLGGGGAGGLAAAGTNGTVNSGGGGGGAGYNVVTKAGGGGGSGIVIIQYLTVDTTPPSSITNLANITNCSQSNITWTNPTDTDFNHTYTLWNNVYNGNKTNSTTFDLHTGLTALTEYTLSTKTCDLSGNCNITWTNHTVTTSTCPTPTPTPTPSPTQTIFPGFGCQFVNYSNVTIDANSSEWQAQENLTTWGILFNKSLNTSSHYRCIANYTATATTNPADGSFNPSTDVKVSFDGFWMIVLLLLIAFFILLRSLT